MTRRGFTLIELVTSLAVLGVLVVAMASSIALASRAMPSSTDEAALLATSSRAWDVIADDLRLASDILVTDGIRIDVTRIEDNPLTTVETVVIEWSGTPGDPLVRTMGAGPNATLLASVDDLTFSAIQERPPRLHAKIQTGGVTLMAQQRCLNTDAIK